MNDIIREIYNRIVELSDLNLQRKLWLNQNNGTGMASSYVEVMCSLFDDFGFDEFIDKTASQVGLSNSTIVELNKLREQLNFYEEKKSDAEIINDSQWKTIADQAKIVLKEWDKARVNKN